MIDPEHILREAKGLLASSSPASSEVRLRTIVSRAYYAAFHSLRLHPRTAHYRRSDDSATGMHKSFTDFLCGTHDDELVHVGNILEVLRRRRILADYRLHLHVDHGLAKRCVEDAEYLCHEALTER